MTCRTSIKAWPESLSADACSGIGQRVVAPAARGILDRRGGRDGQGYNGPCATLPITRMTT